VSLEEGLEKKALDTGRKSCSGAVANRRGVFVSDLIEEVA